MLCHGLSLAQWCSARDLIGRCGSFVEVRMVKRIKIAVVAANVRPFEIQRLGVPIRRECLVRLTGRTVGIATIVGQ